MHLTGKYAAVFRPSGSSATLTAKPIGTGNGTNKYFVLGETLDDCEALTQWTGTSLALDAVDFKEGTQSVKDTIPAAAATYETKWTAPVAIDLTHYRYVSIWLKCSVASAALTNPRIRVYDGANYNYYNVTFAADTWTRLDIVLRSPNGNSGTVPVLSSIDFISFVATCAAGYTLRVDWLTKNPALAENIIIYDEGAVVSAEDYTCSPSGYVTFTTAPIAAHAITATYDYYATIAQVAGAYNWTMERSGDTPESTDYASAGVKEYIAGNTGWTATAERHWETGDLFTPNTTYVARFYVYLAATGSAYYEGETILSRTTIAGPQNEKINETLNFQGDKNIFYITEL